MPPSHQSDSVTLLAALTTYAQPCAGVLGPGKLINDTRVCLCVPQFVREFTKLGLTRSVGGVMALALSRELTPVVTAIIIAGRVGSAFAAELGTMQVRSARDQTTHTCARTYVRGNVRSSRSS